MFDISAAPINGPILAKHQSSGLNNGCTLRTSTSLLADRREMGAYAAPDDTEDDRSVDAVIESQRLSRKRPYPNAFVDTQRQDYDYPSSEDRQGEHAALPVGLNLSSKPAFPFGPTAGQLMGCLRTSVAWIRYAILEYGGKIFSAGTTRITL